MLVIIMLPEEGRKETKQDHPLRKDIGCANCHVCINETICSGTSDPLLEKRGKNEQTKKVFYETFFSAFLYGI